MNFRIFIFLLMLFCSGFVNGPLTAVNTFDSFIIPLTIMQVQSSNDNPIAFKSAFMQVDDTNTEPYSEVNKPSVQVKKNENRQVDKDVKLYFGFGNEENDGYRKGVDKYYNAYYDSLHAGREHTLCSEWKLLQWGVDYRIYNNFYLRNGMRLLYTTTDWTYSHSYDSWLFGSGTVTYHNHNVDYLILPEAGISYHLPIIPGITVLAGAFAGYIYPKPSNNNPMPLNVPLGAKEAPDSGVTLYYERDGFEKGFWFGGYLGNKSIMLNLEGGYSSIPMQFDNAYLYNKADFGGWFVNFNFLIPLCSYTDY